MFANLFFLILNLLLISSVIDQRTSPIFFNQPGLSFSIFLLSYLCLLYLLDRQSSWLHHQCHYRKDTAILIANIELLLFFSFFYFFTGAHHWISNSFKPFGITLFSIFSLGLYFGGLFTCHYAIDRHRDRRAAIKHAWLAVCFLLPFVLPFLFLAFFNDASSLPFINLIPGPESLFGESAWRFVLFTVLNLAIIMSTLILLPPLAVLIWQCPKMKDSELKDELNALCKRAHFKHGGFRIWSVIHNSMTAAIIGVVSKLRYVLFTQKLIDALPGRNIVAILAHEIGHSYYKHLFLYPFILMGMVVVASLVPVMVLTPILQYSNVGEQFPFLIPLFSFVLFGLTMALYFRFVFGYFSRIFERQADLHIFKLGIPAGDMIEALDSLAISAGNIHNDPNWHHYSIRERIDCIRNADRDRNLIDRHSRLVWLSLAVYFLLFTVFTYLLWTLL